jgi:nicotinamide-nucleotide amidase
MMGDAPTLALATDALARARAAGLTIGTVESCTGGLIAGALTAIPGSSDVVTGGLITYSNVMKAKLAAVRPSLIDTHGAVSAIVAAAMAEGGRAALHVDLCVSATGIAGPGGGSALKPVGLVYLALARAEHVTSVCELRLGTIGRDGIRSATVKIALQMIIAALSAPSPAV